MKIKSMVFMSMICVCCLLFGGCSNYSLPDEITSSTSVDSAEESNSGVADDTSEDMHKQNPFSPVTGYGLSRKGDVELSNDGLVKIPMALTGSTTPTNVGVMVFSDGILCESGIDASKSLMNGMTNFDIKKNSTSLYSLYAKSRFDKNMSNHSIAYISLLVPDFVPEMSLPVFGNYHKSLSVSPVSIDIAGNSAMLAEFNIAECGEPRVISEEQKKQYAEGFKLTQKGHKLRENRYYLDNGASALEFELSAYTKTEGTAVYRLSFYKNHKFVNFNGGCEYLDVNMEGGKISLADIRIEDVSAGDFIYCIAIPINGNFELNYPTKSDSVMVVPCDEESPGESESKSENEISGDNSEAVSAAEISEVGEYLFADNDNIYFVDKSGGQICMSGDGKNVSKSVRITNGFIIKSVMKIDYISVIFKENEKIYALLLDKNLSEIKRGDITEIAGDGISTQNKIDFSKDYIVYVTNSGNEIRLCGWNLNSAETVIKSKDKLFTAAALSGNNIAYTSTGRENGKQTRYYGVTDFDGNSENYLKTKVHAPYMLEDTVMWCNSHVREESEADGEIVLFKDGIFERIKLETDIESTYAYLCVDNNVLTYCEEDSAGKFTLYKNGKKTREIHTDKLSLGGGRVMLFDDKIYANVSDKTLVWEMN